MFLPKGDEMFIGICTGLVVGSLISYVYIFPNDMLFKLAYITEDNIDDLLRMLGGGMVILVLGCIGGFMGSYSGTGRK